VTLARRYGVYRTARLLHLEARKLKRLVGPGEAAARGASAQPTFVELMAPGAASSGECTIAIEGPRGGRVWVQLRGAAPPDVVALSRVVWGRRA
jgi:hypothetical protein